MQVKPVSIVHQILLTKSESESFRKRFPSSRDIEAWAEDIKEDGVSLFIVTEEEEVIIEVVTDFDVIPLINSVRAEVLRIQSQIEHALLNT